MRIYPKIVPVLFLALILIFCPGAGAFADEGIPSPYEEELLRMINDARQAPLAMAESLGMDPEQVLSDLPELRDILTGGLPPLTFNEALYAVAGGHTQDMIAGNYYSHDSSDGRSYNDRIIDAGYVDASLPLPDIKLGESLGMLAFANFIDPAEAVRILFENIFTDELDPAGTEERNILDPDMREAGIALKAGAFDLGGSFCNVYLVTCHFGAGPVSDLEIEFLELINQARADPLAVAQSFGLEPDQILGELPELYDILTEGLPPLTLNLDLYASAAAHAGDMLENSYYSYTSFDGRTIGERIRESGYDPVVTGETIRLFATIDPWEPAEGAATVFRQMFRRELSANCAERNILNPEFKEVGVRLAVGSPRQWEESSGLYSYSSCYTLLLVADFGACVYPADDIP